jgi:hypothetical protein
MTFWALNNEDETEDRRSEQKRHSAQEQDDVADQSILKSRERRMKPVTNPESGLHYCHGDRGPYQRLDARTVRGGIGHDGPNAGRAKRRMISAPMVLWTKKLKRAI